MEKTFIILFVLLFVLSVSALVTSILNTTKEQTGSVGPKGPTGATGLTGPTGPTGANGLTTGTIKGTVRIDGVFVGNGFTVEKNGMGLFTITFDYPFTDNYYALVITPNSTIGAMVGTTCLPSTAVVHLYNGDNTQADSGFSFIAMYLF